MRHMYNGQNIGIIATRQTRDPWGVFATNIIIGHKSMAAYDVNNLFPLYLYPDNTPQMFDFAWPPGKNGRRPNLVPEFVSAFAEKLRLQFITDGRGDLSKTFGPEDIFSYIYATLHSPTYRERYAEFLRIEFPRVPLANHRELFAGLARLGGKLVDLHLLRHIPGLITTYPVKGTDQVASGHPHYVEPSGNHEGRVYINAEQYFEGVDPDVWAFHIGGYQVLEKWLKDRRGRALSYEDIRHYQKIVVALKETIRIMGEIDEAVESAGGWPIQ